MRKGGLRLQNLVEELKAMVSQLVEGNFGKEKVSEKVL